MKSFLLKNNVPTIKWSMLKDNTFFEGTVPEGYDLAVAPSDNIIILDVDNKNGKNGFLNIFCVSFCGFNENIYMTPPSNPSKFYLSLKFNN